MRRNRNLGKLLVGGLVALARLLAAAFGLGWTLRAPAPPRRRVRVFRVAAAAADDDDGRAAEPREPDDEAEADFEAGGEAGPALAGDRPSRGPGRGATGTVVALLVAATVGGVGSFIGVKQSNASQAREMAKEMTGGDPDRGRQAMDTYGCASCHTIPGVRGADALVGPPLTQVGGRSYIGGVLTNTPENLIRWVQDPPAVDPKTAMPNVGVTDPDARDIAAYLYTLR